ncbi:MAG: hypothetical protein ACFNVQ_02510 [Campylobacter sp.]
MFASILREFFRIFICILAIEFKILQNFKATEFYKIFSVGLGEKFYEHFKACDEILKFYEIKSRRLHLAKQHKKVVKF